MTREQSAPLTLLALTAALSCALSGCGGTEPGGGPQGGRDSSAPNVIDQPAPAGTDRGRVVATELGCLACHRIGDDGATGPGPALTRVGDRLPRAAIERTLRFPQAPMPSYRDLVPEDFDALVDYLAALR